MEYEETLPGNYMQYVLGNEDVIVVLESINEDIAVIGCNFPYKGIVLPAGLLFPIKLSVDILLAFSFKENIITNTKVALRVRKFTRDNIIVMVKVPATPKAFNTDLDLAFVAHDDLSTFFLHIVWVHELQNIFKMSTGNCLTWD